MKSSFYILYEFLKNNNIDLNLNKYISVIKNKPKIDIDNELINNIIVDAYKGFSETVKEVANIINTKTGIILGRKEKKVIKKMLDYLDFSDKEIILSQLKKPINIEKLIIDKRNQNIHIIRKSVDTYIENLRNEINNKNSKKIKDYLNFLYSRLIAHNERKTISLNELLNDNLYELSKLHTKKQIDDFSETLKKYDKNYLFPIAVRKYNELYKKKFISNNNNKYDLIAFEINQNIYEQFNDYNKFIEHIFKVINKSYTELINHRTLTIKINNIIINDKNIKWDLFSIISIYAENFIKHNSSFYKPEIICADYLEHKYNLEDIINIQKILNQYYLNKISFINLKEKLNIELNKEEIDFFKYYYKGFQFQDNFILKRNNTFLNSKEINFIKNSNELLMIFSKNEVNEKKVPCPVCSSLKISGNSYTEIGIKSWECKNELCPGRSKSNRGKRYSIKTIEMQNSVADNEKENLIDKGLISKWRKDIIDSKNYDTLLEMLVRFFSYKNGNIALINFKKNDFVENCFSRNIYMYKSIDFENRNYSKLNKSFSSIFIYNKKEKIENKELKVEKNDKYAIYNANCISVLSKTHENSIEHMVTSPPYYNAREYSQWKNFYNYLNDMYKINKLAFKALKPGGVFFYNVGDIFDNPNTIIKSKMGDTRISLGAYIIYIFKKAGFELLDNIIWDKGEAQSNRHKNDGNFTPYYQRPANVYEHMFIFKKPGNLITSITPLINSNIIKFSPVIKINNKGINKYGHTAPYPIELPNLSILTFSKKNDKVFDPFLGSGTSVISALLNNRYGIGVELDTSYFNLAKKMIKEKSNIFILDF
jgi:DNA modification methylase